MLKSVSFRHACEFQSDLSGPPRNRRMRLEATLLRYRFHQIRSPRAPSIEVPPTETLHTHENVARLVHSDFGPGRASRWEPKPRLMGSRFRFPGQRGRIFRRAPRPHAFRRMKMHSHIRRTRLLPPSNAETEDELP